MNLRTTLRRSAIAPSLIGLAIAAATLVPDDGGAAASSDIQLVSAPTAPRPVEIHRHAIAPILFRLPVEGYHLTGRFGDVSGLWATVHTGLDFAVAEGTPIHAVSDGTVVSTEYDGSYGNKTVLRLEDGTELWFCHQSAFEVQPGEKVVAGQVIGLVGATGNTTGPHVHLEVHPGGGDAVDPYPWLVAHGLQP